MKKIFMFAAVAAMMAACSSSDEVAQLQDAKQQGLNPVNFSFYTPRSITRAGLPGGYVAGDGLNGYGVTTTSITTGNAKKHETAGIGMFGFFTNNGEYDTNSSTPNFMYNQQVLYTANPKFAGTTAGTWTYEPVKYWPNEYGDAAKADDVDRLSFFCYAPYIDVDVTNGTPVVTSAMTDEEIYQEQKLNITQLSKNTATGDPIVKYVVDTKPSTSVDLLWGVAADDATVKSLNDDSEQAAAGNPFLNLVKQNDVTGDLKWTMKHALAMLNVQIVMAVDAPTAKAYDPATSNVIGQEGEDGTTDNFTKVYLRSITFENGFAMQGALNLHSETAADVASALPNWKDYDGVKEIAFDQAVTFYDGLKDGKEGTTNNIQKNEKPQGLNPVLLEEATATTWEAKKAGIPTDAFVNLFDGANGDPKAPIYVIPSGEDMNVIIEYDIQTQDEKLAATLSDALNHGSAIANKIYKENVFGQGIEPGKFYSLKIIVGVESVKFEVEVLPWVDGNPDEETELPENK
jgi:hypothetical protein